MRLDTKCSDVILLRCFTVDFYESRHAISTIIVRAGNQSINQSCLFNRTTVRPQLYTDVHR